MRLASLLAVSGVLLLVGLGLSYGGSELATEGLETVASALDAGNILEAGIELDPRVSRDGVYAVRSVGEEHDGVMLRVTDPGGVLIGELAIQEDAGEEEFVIASAGKYTLEATNTSSETRNIVIAVGYKAEDYVIAIVAVGSYVIIAGMIAMAASVAYAIVRSRVKR